jgi:hypothetical protein
VLARLSAFTTDHVGARVLGVRITARVAVHHSQQGLVVEQAAAVKIDASFPSSRAPDIIHGQVDADPSDETPYPKSWTFLKRALASFNRDSANYFNDDTFARLQVYCPLNLC